MNTSLSLLKSVAAVIIAVVIGYFYIYPTLLKIKETQDKTLLFSQEIKKVSDVNTDLNAKIATIQSISTRDREALSTFLPKTVDTVAVLKDLAFRAEQNGLVIESLSAGSGQQSQTSTARQSTSQSESASNDQSGVTPLDFALSVYGSYEQILLFLQNIERNVFVYQVSELTLTPREDGTVGAVMRLTVFEESTVTSQQEITEQI